MTNLVNTSNSFNSSGFNPNVDNKRKIANASFIAKIFRYLSFVLIITIFIHISMRNNFFNLQTQINELSSGIDVQLKKKRYISKTFRYC